MYSHWKKSERLKLSQYYAPFHASCENKAQIITCQSTCTFIGSGQHSYYLNLFLLTGGAGKLEEIPGRLAAQRGQLGAASEEIHRGACHQFGMFIFQCVGIIGDRKLCCLHLHTAHIKNS